MGRRHFAQRAGGERADDVAVLTRIPLTAQRPIIYVGFFPGLGTTVFGFSTNVMLSLPRSWCLVRAGSAVVRGPSCR
jgi:hypothetical protein